MLTVDGGRLRTDSQSASKVQSDGRIRLWAKVPKMEGRYLRVVLLPDRETVHDAFFDRGVKP